MASPAAAGFSISAATCCWLQTAKTFYNPDHGPLAWGPQSAISIPPMLRLPQTLVHISHLSPSLVSLIWSPMVCYSLLKRYRDSIQDPRPGLRRPDKGTAESLQEPSPHSRASKRPWSRSRRHEGHACEPSPKKAAGAEYLQVHPGQRMKPRV